MDSGLPLRGTGRAFSAGDGGGDGDRTTGTPMAKNRIGGRRKREGIFSYWDSAQPLFLRSLPLTRLEPTAIERGSTASAVAAEILDRNLPRLRIAIDD